MLLKPNCYWFFESFLERKAGIKKRGSFSLATCISRRSWGRSLCTSMYFVLQCAMIRLLLQLKKVHRILNWTFCCPFDFILWTVAVACVELYSAKESSKTSLSSLRITETRDCSLYALLISIWLSFHFSSATFSCYLSNLALFILWLGGPLGKTILQRPHEPEAGPV